MVTHQYELSLQGNGDAYLPPCCFLWGYVHKPCAHIMSNQPEIFWGCIIISSKRTLAQLWCNELLQLSLAALRPVIVVEMEWINISLFIANFCTVFRSWEKLGKNKL